MQNTLLTPRFYTTDFDALDASTSARARGVGQADRAMKIGPEQGHFKKNEDWDQIDWDAMEPEARPSSRTS
jgi:magnesium-protoporphyrin IX monomethyl ester (oxidative) cyclase